MFSYFPKIFGKDENQPLDDTSSKREFTKLTKQVNSFLSGQNKNHKKLSVEEVAMGFIDVANESMCRPIRALTQVICVRYMLFFSILLCKRQIAVKMF